MNKFAGVTSRSTFFGVVIVLLSLISAQAQTNASVSSVTNRPAAPRRPSIVLILADNIGYGDLGCYGQKKIKTPHLDKLASEGIRFTSFYTGSPLDEPARASLFTGFEPRHIGASFSHPLPIDAYTLPAFLREVGYHTGLMGEWNLGDTPPVQPMAKGFDEFAGFLSQAHARNYFSDTIYRQDTETGSNRVESLPDNWNGVQRLYVPDLLGTAANNFIRINAPDRLNHYQPFFLCIAYPIPHNGVQFKDTTYAEESWPEPEKQRAAMITRMDENIGSVLNQLTFSKADTNTVVIFTSVGGPLTEGPMQSKFFDSAGPLRGEAGSVYEAGIRVPMIIRWPAQIQPGRVSHLPWAAWDLLATAADIAFTKPARNTDGMSILPVLIGKGEAKAHKDYYWESDDGENQQAVRMEDWKLVQIGTNAPALYNLKTDVGEQDDVSGKNPEVVKRMKAVLNDSSK